MATGFIILAFAHATLANKLYYIFNSGKRGQNMYTPLVPLPSYSSLHISDNIHFTIFLAFGFRGKILFVECGIGYISVPGATFMSVCLCVGFHRENSPVTETTPEPTLLGRLTMPKITPPPPPPTYICLNLVYFSQHYFHFVLFSFYTHPWW